MSHSPHNPADKGAAYTGLVVGALVIFAILFGIVKLTNSHYASEGAEHAPAAGAPAGSH